MSTNLLNEIDAFLAERKIGDHRFGVLAINNGRLLERLRSGRRIWPETADKVRQFMERERQAISAKKSNQTASSSAGDDVGAFVTPPAQKGAPTVCQGRAEVARLAHNQEVAGSNPAPATSSNSPDHLPSGEAGAQRSPAGCAPATFIKGVAR